MNQKIIKAVDSAQRAQQNYDLSKSVPQDDLDTLLLVGVGFDNAGSDRRLHAELLNKDVLEKFRTGDENEHCQFPSFNKQVKVFINGTIT